MKKNDHLVKEKLTVEPLNAGNWDHFERLFGVRGACGNCWCMAYRLPKSAFEEGKRGGGNKKAMQALIRKGRPTGLLGFVNGEAVAWCALSPREDFPKLDRSRVHRRIDDQPVWSIPCLFIKKGYRNQGLSADLLKAVVRYAGQTGIPVLEAYPVVPTSGRLPDAFAWAGLLTAYLQSGFAIADRTSKNRPMVRCYPPKTF